MKRLFLLSVLIVNTLFILADDSGTCGPNLTWKYTADTNTLTIEGTGEMNDYALQRPWDKYRSNIKNIFINSGVTSIGNGAFHIPNVSSIYIPNSVTSIGQGAFYGCKGLTSVTIPNSVTSIGQMAFAYCEGLTSMTIPSSVTNIGQHAFSACTDLTTIIVENGNPKYDSRNNCNAIIETATNTLIGGCKTALIPNSVTSIGNGAFYGCSGLTSITIPNSVTNIGEEAFAGCSGLTSVTIPNSITNIEGFTFAYCSALTSVTIPNSVTSIGNDAFRDCSSLTSVTIPNSVTSIGNSAFSNCSSLSSVTIPNSMTYVAASAFYNTAWYNNKPDGLVYAGKVAYRYKGTMPSGTSITLEDGTIGIASAAFYGCTGLTSVTIPNSVTSIGSDAFYGCSGLSSVTIPNSVTSIGYVAFSSCTGLTTIIVENGNPKYDSRNNCNAIIETATNTLIGGCKTALIPNSVTSIGYGAFSSCTGLTSVTIPNSVTSIGYGAFSSCTGLNSVTIPNSVTSIGSYAFNGCSGLTSITIPNSVTSIGKGAFDRTEWFNNKPDGLVYAGKVAYRYKGTMPSSIILEEGTTGIAGDAFSGCTGLTSVTIPNSVISIGDGAFDECWELTSVTIPNSVISIGDGAFDYCVALTSVTIGNGVTSIGGGAFIGCNIPTVISLIENPFVISGKIANVPTFTLYTFNNATLYIPNGTIEKYKATTGWKDFINIVEMEPSAIQTVKKDAAVTLNGPATIYNLKGELQTAPLEALPHGIYIVNGKTLVK